MTRYMIGLKRSGITPVVLVLLCMTVFGMGVWSSGINPNIQDGTLPEVKNETESFQLVSIEKAKDSILLRMKNISGQGITAYSVASHDNGREDTDYSIGDYMIANGAIEEIEIPLSSLRVSNASKQRKPDIRILAVVFEDQTSEGDYAAAADIRNIRLGKKIQLKRINQLILEASNLSSTNQLSTLKDLKSRIASLSEDIERGQTPAVRSGLRNAKQDVLTLIDRIEQRQKAIDAGRQADNSAGNDLHGELIKLVREGEKWIAKY